MTTPFSLISYCFPPLLYPQSIQMARIVQYLRASPVRVFCGDERTPRDMSLMAGLEREDLSAIRIPWTPRASIARQVRRFTLRHRLLHPDAYRPWATVAARVALKQVWDEREVFMTSGQPMSDHLVGLQLKEKLNLPWIAHFSDPWVDNPYVPVSRMTRRRHLQLEERVLTAADAIVVTTQETAELMRANHPGLPAGSLHVIPHSFDERLFPKSPENSAPGITIRFVGNFYGARSPRPLLSAISSVAERAPEVLAGVRFELIGHVGSGVDTVPGLPGGVVTFLPSVGYARSLELMAGADALLLVEAPGPGLFLPSKLIDYLGAARPILAIAPEGSAARIVLEAGGWVAPPSDVRAIALMLQEALDSLRTRTPQVNPSVRRRFAADEVAKRFDAVVSELRP